MKELKGIECPHCCEFVTANDLNVTRFEIAMETRFQCEECNEVYIDKEYAEECCKE